MALGTFFKGPGGGAGGTGVAGGRIHARIDGDGGLKTSGGFIVVLPHCTLSYPRLP